MKSGEATVLGGMLFGLSSSERDWEFNSPGRGWGTMGPSLLTLCDRTIPSMAIHEKAKCHHLRDFLLRSRTRSLRASSIGYLPDQLFFPVETVRQEVHNLSNSWPRSRKRAETETTPLEHDCGKETILVVDDDDSLRTVIVDLLGHLGYSTLSAANAADAMQLSQDYQGKIDLLLTDVAMHPLTGPALAEKLMRSRPEMKVIYISGYANAALAPDGVLKPGTVLVDKPFTMKILSAKLREVLGNPTTA